MSKTKKGEVLPKKEETAKISLETTEANVLKWNQEGRKLVFDPEAFKVLPDDIVRDLSHENARTYFAMYNQHLAVQREKASGTFGREKIRTERREIIDPLGGHAGAKTNYKPKGEEGKKFLEENHLYLAGAWEVEDRKELGYEILSADDPVVTRGNTSSSTSRVIRNKGEDELVWMKLPKRTYDQHIAAVTGKSAEIVRGAPAEFAGKLEEVSKGKAKPMEIEPELEKVTMTQEQFAATEGK